jgi:tetratricopeptide (TPR) repeat protein
MDRWLEASASRDLGWIARRAWMRLILGAILGLGAALIYCYFVPDIYIARAQVRFLPPQVSERLVPPNFSREVEQRVDALRQLVASRLTATKLIEHFGLYPERRIFWTVTDLVPVLQEDLTIRAAAPAGDRKAIPTVLVQFRYRNPEIARKVLQRAVELVYEENRRYRTGQTVGATEFLEQELELAANELAGLEEQLSQFDASHSEEGARGMMKSFELSELDRRESSLQEALRRLTIDRDLRRAAVSAIEGQIADAGKNLNPDAAPRSYAGDQARLSVRELEMRAQELRHRYAPGHADLLFVERELASGRSLLQAEHAKEVSAYREHLMHELRTELRRAQSDLRAFEATWVRQSRELRELQDQVRTLRGRYVPQGQDVVGRLQIEREYAQAKANYLDLTRKLRESRVSSNMERKGQGETVELIEPPVAPTTPELPTRPMKLGAGCLAGIAAAYLLSLLAFLIRPCVREPHHVEVLGQLPVLASIPSGGALPLLLEGSRKSPWSAKHRTLASLLPLSLVLLSAASCRVNETAQDRWRRGDGLFTKGDLANAAIECKRALQLDPRHGPSHELLASLYLKNAEAEPARQHLIRALEAFPARRDLAVRLAELTYSIYFADPGRPEPLLREVEELGQRLLKSWPASPDGYRILGQILLERRKTGEAIRLMEGAAHLKDSALLTQLSAAHYRKGESAKAEAILRGVIHQSPSFNAAFDLLYLQLLERGDPAAGRALLAEKLQRQQTVAAGLQLAAHDLARNDESRLPETLAILERLAAHEPTGWAHIGDFWLHRQAPDRALECFTRGLAAHPAQKLLYTARKAEALLAQREPARAKALVDGALRQSPNDPMLTAYRSAIELESSEPAVRKQARLQLERILSQMPNSAFVRYHLGRSYLRDGDLSRASEQLERCILLDPNYAPGWVALADAEIRAGQAGSAQRRLKALLAVNPRNAEARVLQARASLLTGQFTEAAQAAAALASTDSAKENQFEALLVLAAALQASGKSKDSAAALERARALNPQDPRPALELGSIALREGRAASALAHFEDLVRRHPSHAEYRLGFANALGLAGRLQDAQAEYKTVQAATPGDARPWILHGALLSNLGRTAAARDAYQQAIEREPNNPFALNNLAYLLARSQGDFQAALTHAEQAKRYAPRSGEVNDTLAYIYVALGMRRNAQALLEEMLTQPGGASSRTERIRQLIRNGDLAGARREFERPQGRS